MLQSGERCKAGRRPSATLLLPCRAEAFASSATLLLPAGEEEGGGRPSCPGWGLCAAGCLGCLVGKRL